MGGAVPVALLVTSSPVPMCRGVGCCSGGCLGRSRLSGCGGGECVRDFVNMS